MGCGSGKGWKIYDILNTRMYIIIKLKIHTYSWVARIYKIYKPSRCRSCTCISLDMPERNYIAANTLEKFFFFYSHEHTIFGYVE